MSRRDTHRPREADGEAYGVGEGVMGSRLRELKGVGAEHRGDCAAVGAGGLWGHAALVVLQADAEQRLTFAGRSDGGRGSAAASCLAPFIQKLLQHQLKAT